MLNEMSHPVLGWRLVAGTGIDHQTAMRNHSVGPVMNQPDAVIKSVLEQLHLVSLPGMQR